MNMKYLRQKNSYNFDILPDHPLLTENYTAWNAKKLTHTKLDIEKKLYRDIYYDEIIRKTLMASSVVIGSMTLLAITIAISARL